jgi:hypothetical protein
MAKSNGTREIQARISTFGKDEDEEQTGEAGEKEFSHYCNQSSLIFRWFLRAF